MEEDNRLPGYLSVLGVGENTTVAEFHTILWDLTNHGIALRTATVCVRTVLPPNKHQAPEARVEDVKRLLMSSSALGVDGWFEDGWCDHAVDVGEEFSGDVAP